MSEQPRSRSAPAGRRSGCGPARGRLLQPRRVRPRDARRRHARRAERRPLRGRDRLPWLRRTGSAESNPIAKVGVAYNDSPESKAALALAREFAARTGATVHALEVVSIPTYAYTGIVPPRDRREYRGDGPGGERPHARRWQTSRVARCTASPVRSSPRSAIRWISSSSAHAATVQSSAWCSAAPPPTCSATHAAHCSYCPAQPPAQARTPSRGPTVASVTDSPRCPCLASKVTFSLGRRLPSRARRDHRDCVCATPAVQTRRTHAKPDMTDLPVPMSGAVATVGLGRSTSQSAACRDDPLLEGEAGFKRAAYGTGLRDAL